MSNEWRLIEKSKHKLPNNTISIMKHNICFSRDLISRYFQGYWGMEIYEKKGYIGFKPSNDKRLSYSLFNINSLHLKCSKVFNMEESGWYEPEWDSDKKILLIKLKKTQKHMRYKK